ncbi:hypothetical protein CARUB_v10025725mg [Capsella rubella]|uniref:Ribonucleotide reductase large subunit C-terminal domain-containing protein n=1 Tax=Capsella rubella TaxID=81985 RepID=R0G2A4_9BRAS|nr:hypothetical protein CARUB_v10025725mg [Capsella rubella]
MVHSCVSYSLQRWNSKASTAFWCAWKMIALMKHSKECAVISKSAGGIGVSVHNIRGTNGTSNDIVPMLRVFNATARYVDQGGKRKGAFDVYLEPWHAVVFEFLELRNHGKEEHNGRDLFYALWVPDLFVERVQSNGQWSLFCLNEAPGLEDCWGTEFETLYTKYERQVNPYLVRH